MTDPAAPASKLDKAVLCAALLLIVCGLGGYARKAVEESYRADFQRYYYAGCVALHGGNIYEIKDKREFKYFPFFAQVMIPVAWVAETISPPEDGDEPFANDAALRTGATIWYAILCLSYFGTILLATLMCKPPTLRRGMLIALVALAVSARFFSQNIRNGQINMPVMFLAVLGCWLILNRRSFWGGAAIGLGAAIKFMPALLILWCVRKKEWRACGGILAAVLVALLAVPAVTWGVSGSKNLLEGYIRDRHKMVTGVPKADAAGQSLPSMLNRLLRPVKANTLQYRDEEDNPVVMHINIADLPAGTVGYLALAVIILTCLAAWRSLSPGRAAPSSAAVLELGLMFLLMLLVSPESRKAHFITAIVPAAALAAFAFEYGLSRFHLALLGCAFFLTSLTSSGILGKNVFYFTLNAYGVVMWGALLVFVVISEILRRRKTPDGVGAPSSV